MTAKVLFTPPVLGRVLGPKQAPKALIALHLLRWKWIKADFFFFYEHHGKNSKCHDLQWSNNFCRPLISFTVVQPSLESVLRVRWQTSQQNKSVDFQQKLLSDHSSVTHFDDTIWRCMMTGQDSQSSGWRICWHVQLCCCRAFWEFPKCSELWPHSWDPGELPGQSSGKGARSVHLESSGRTCVHHCAKTHTIAWDLKANFCHPQNSPPLLSAQAIHSMKWEQNWKGNHSVSGRLNKTAPRHPA